MLSSPFAFLSLVLGVVGYVNASPLSSADSLTNAGSCIGSQPQECTPGVNCPSPSEIDEVLITHAPNVSVFWAGHYPANGTTIEPKAAACAAKKNGATIGMLLCQYNIKMPVKGNDPLWAHASKTYAEQAKGIVYVTLGASLFELATFFNLELPTLIKNPNVTSIVSVDAGTTDFKDLCYWHCADGKHCPVVTVGIISYTAILNFI